MEYRVRVLLRDRVNYLERFAFVQNQQTELVEQLASHSAPEFDVIVRAVSRNLRPSPNIMGTPSVVQYGAYRGALLETATSRQLPVFAVQLPKPDDPGTFKMPVLGVPIRLTQVLDPPDFTWLPINGAEFANAPAVGSVIDFATMYMEAEFARPMAYDVDERPYARYHSVLLANRVVPPSERTNISTNSDDDEEESEDTWEDIMLMAEIKLVGSDSTSQVGLFERALPQPRGAWLAKQQSVQTARAAPAPPQNDAKPTTVI